jgi:sulfur-carrier protein
MSSSLDIRYFAWVRARLERSGDRIEIPAEGLSIAGIMDQLAGLSETHAAIFHAESGLKSALNQEFCEADAIAHPGDEVAFFPPVTGG